MNQNEALISYIKTQLDKHTPIDSIKQQLVGNGWNVAVVDEALRQITPEPASAVPTPPVAPPESEAAMTYSAFEQPMQTQPVTQPQPIAAETVTLPISAPEHYTLIGAIKESFSAISNNLVAVIVAGIISVVVPVIIWVIAAIALFSVILANSAINFMPGRGGASLGALMSLVVALIVVVFLQMLGAALAQSMLGLALNDGAEGKRSSIKHIFSTGLSRMFGVLVAIFLQGLPTLIIIIVAMTLLFVVAAAVKSLAILVFLLVPIALIFAALVYLYLMLMPVLALFEPETPRMQLYSRARQLMAGGGGLFVVKLFLSAILVAILFGIIFPEAGRQGGSIADPKSFIVTLVAALFSVLYYGILIVFYRNRRAVRG